MRKTWIGLASAVFLTLTTGCGKGTQQDDPPDASMEVDQGQDMASDLGQDTPDADMAAPAEDMPGAEDMEDWQPGPDVALDADGATLTISPTEGALVWTRDSGEELLRFPLDGVQLGRVPVLTDTASYNPYGFKVPLLGRTPPLEAWHTVARVEVEEQDASSARVALTLSEGLTATLTVEVTAPGRARLALTPGEPAEGHVAYMRLRPVVDTEEGFYGLGEYFDSAEHRGYVRAMQLEVDGELESGYNEAHVPIPFVIGTRGWGLFVASDRPGVFDVAAEADDRLDVIFGTGAASSSEGLTFHLFASSHPLDVTRHYYDVTGDPKLPARWALGPLVWRDESEDQAEVISDAETMRALDLPASGYWIDRPYARAVNTFDFEPTQFPDPEAMIDRLHELGLRVALWHTPYLDENRDVTLPLREEAMAQGYYPPTIGVPLNGWGPPIDLTNPAAKAWWQGLIDNYTSIGIEGFKLDYGEDIVPGVFGRRVAWEFADGSTERTMHARFQELYHATYAEMLPQDGAFLLCRAGTWGDQRNGPIIWPGDLDANMLEHRDEGVDRNGEPYVAVGGLPAALIGGLSLGPSGFPFYGSDTGGYRHSPPDRETFTRWFEQTALSTVMQIGTSTNDVAWEYNEENGFDEEMLGWYRRYTRLHLRLFPYLWTYAERLAEDGRAIQRPLGLAYPELGVHPSDTYMLGDALLVAPVVTRGARTRDVILPPGDWIDWWTGEVLAGDRTVTVDAPLDTLPLYLRAGGIVPLLRPTIDTMAPTTEPMLVDSYATTPGVLYPVIGAGASGAFELFDGARVEVEVGADAVTLTVSDGDEFTQGMQLEVLGVAAAPAEVRLDGAPLAQVADLEALEQAGSGWVYVTSPRAALHVRAPAGEHTLSW